MLSLSLIHWPFLVKDIKVRVSLSCSEPEQKEARLPSFCLKLDALENSKIYVHLELASVGGTAGNPPVNVHFSLCSSSPRPEIVYWDTEGYPEPEFMNVEFC